MKSKVCLFAGTTEGRVIADLLKDAVDLTACVATEYGGELLDGVNVHTGRMSADEMREFFESEGFELIIDATHPYAVEVTNNIKEASSVPVMRILRESDETISDAVCVENAEAAKSFLETADGNVLLTTGSKELSVYKGLDLSRIWARVLPADSSLEACREAGFDDDHIIAAQGPFSYEENLEQLKKINAKYLVTKMSGKSGGFDEKIRAAKYAGAIPVIIGLPPQTEGLTLDEATAELKRRYL